MHAFAKDSLDQNHGQIGVPNPQTIVRLVVRHSQRDAMQMEGLVAYAVGIVTVLG
jgi:hypothetical protein